MGDMDICAYGCTHVIQLSMHGCAIRGEKVCMVCVLGFNCVYGVLVRKYEGFLWKEECSMV
jgi:hypothetical protein